MRVTSAIPAVIALIPVMASMGGCAANPDALPKYQPPPEGEPAAVITVSKRGRAWSVDGADSSSYTKSVRLRPGEHRVGIRCSSFEVASIDMLPGGSRSPLTPMVNARSAAQFILVTGAFEAGKSYYTRCVTLNDRPRAWLADTPDGRDLPPGFTSMCTRDCPH